MSGASRREKRRSRARRLEPQGLPVSDPALCQIAWARPAQSSIYLDARALRTSQTRTTPVLARGSTHRAVRTPFLVRLRCRLQGKPLIGGEGPLWLAVLSTYPRYAIDLDRFILGTEARRCASRIDLRLLAATLFSGKRRRPRLRVPPAVLPVTRGPASGAPLRGAAPQPPRQARRALQRRGGAFRALDTRRIRLTVVLGRNRLQSAIQNFGGRFGAQSRHYLAKKYPIDQD